MILAFTVMFWLHQPHHMAPLAREAPVHAWHINEARR
jgi:hypothetical protein